MKEKIVWIFVVLYLCSFHLNAQNAENNPTGGGYQVAAEGAWCWFADPRALHYENKEGTINKTYIGYIDIHGNIKAMQYDFQKKEQEEVLIRSYFQPDDHNNPTFLVLPDERIMIFYSRHTDEPCFYYRVSRIPPYQIVQSTGARPYAKYMSNGKDKIYLTYTTGHPDNELPNFLYFNYIDIKTLQLTDVRGTVLSTIADGTFKVNKTGDYAKQYPSTVVDNPSERDWVWQIASDRNGNPVIAMVRISDNKESHDYYYAKWNGHEWKKTFLINAGGHFHQTPNLEKCYSAGMAIDPSNVNEVYCSLPVEGKYGKVYEIVRFIMSEDGEVISKEAVTKDSQLNNVRPYMIPASEGTPLRLTWMYGNYYDWIVSLQHPQGYSTGIACDFKGFPDRKKKKMIAASGKEIRFDPEKPFVLEQTITLGADNYQGCLLQLGDLEYYLNGETMKPEIRYKGKVYTSTNVLGTSDCWKTQARGTGGKWYTPQKYGEVRLRMEYKKGVLCVYINDLLDQRIDFD